MKPVQIVPQLEQSPAPDQFPHLELARLQVDLDRLREKITNEQDTPSPEINDESALSCLVKEILRSRRRRETIFGVDLFGEPAWDILLELYVAEVTQERLCISSACYASAVPASTALRWITRLENDGWIERNADPQDRRRTWLSLTSRGLTGMRRFLNELAIRPAQVASPRSG